MRRRFLGKSNLETSVIGMGCWSFGGGAYWGAQNQRDVDNTVAMALDAGINFFDTAEMYNEGASEESLGIALKGRRNKALVCSKISPENAFRDTMAEHCKASLRRLDMEYLDLYMLHWPLDTLPSDAAKETVKRPSIEEAFEAMARLKQEGLVRNIGVSNFGARQLAEAIRYCDEIVCNELTYNILSRAIEKEIIPLCEEKGIGIIAAMTLQQGLLAGIYDSPEDVPQSVARSRHFHHARGNGTSRHGLAGEEEETFRVIAELKGVAEEMGVSAAELSAAWVIARSGVECALVGSRDTAELKDNLKAAELILDPSVTEKIDELSEPLLRRLGYNPDYYENERNARIR